MYQKIVLHWLYKVRGGKSFGEMSKSEHHPYPTLVRGRKSFVKSVRNLFRLYISLRKALADKFKSGGDYLSNGVIDIRVRGAVAEKFVEIDLIKRGYIPYSPVLENTTCDLVVDTGGRLVKIQVKSSKTATEGAVFFDITRPSAKNPHYSKEDFDVLALYDTVNNKLAYLPWRTLPHKRKITLRYTPELNSNGFVKKHGRLFFDELSSFPSIEEIFPNESEAIS